MLTESDWQVSEIGHVVEAAIAPHRDGVDRIAVEGPPIDLTARQSMGLALAVHELATNATKYGALSKDNGRVDIAWSRNGGDSFAFVWHELDGPQVQPPSQKGFGTRLTEIVVPGYFAGSARIDYRPEGLAYTLEGSLAGDDKAGYGAK